ncbi:MAG TPA: hypothetical protein VFB32_18305 [Rudaea sp.]|nr:hypothetical protein [Rudaea sp.]
MKRYLALAMLLATSAIAQPASDQPPSQGGTHRHGPPPEAIAACSGKAADAACSFTGRQGETLQGKCFAPRSRGDEQGSPHPLACRPDRPPPQG